MSGACPSFLFRGQESFCAIQQTPWRANSVIQHRLGVLRASWCCASRRAVCRVRYALARIGTLWCLNDAPRGDPLSCETDRSPMDCDPFDVRPCAPESYRQWSARRGGLQQAARRCRRSACTPVAETLPLPPPSVSPPGGAPMAMPGHGLSRHRGGTADPGSVRQTGRLLIVRECPTPFLRCMQQDGTHAKARDSTTIPTLPKTRAGQAWSRDHQGV